LRGNKPQIEIFDGGIGMANKEISLEPSLDGYKNMRLMLLQQVEAGNDVPEIRNALDEIEIYLDAIGELV
jgi:hypothetical protein